jgi:hypothetical protein
MSKLLPFVAPSIIHFTVFARIGREINICPDSSSSLIMGKAFEFAELILLGDSP